MKKNVGTSDRLIRILVAIIIGILYFTDSIGGALGGILLIVAVIFLLTGLMGTCGLYVPFGISTCKRKDRTS